MDDKIDLRFPEFIKVAFGMLSLCRLWTVLLPKHGTDYYKFEIKDLHLPILYLFYPSFWIKVSRDHFLLDLQMLPILLRIDQKICDHQ